MLWQHRINFLLIPIIRDLSNFLDNLSQNGLMFLSLYGIVVATVFIIYIERVQMFSVALETFFFVLSDAIVDLLIWVLILFIDWCKEKSILGLVIIMLISAPLFGLGEFLYYKFFVKYSIWLNLYLIIMLMAFVICTKKIPLLWVALAIVFLMASCIIGWLYLIFLFKVIAFMNTSLNVYWGQFFILLSLYLSVVIAINSKIITYTGIFFIILLHLIAYAMLIL